MALHIFYIPSDKCFWFVLKLCAIFVQLKQNVPLKRFLMWNPNLFSLARFVLNIVKTAATLRCPLHNITADHSTYWISKLSHGSWPVKVSIFQNFFLSLRVEDVKNGHSPSLSLAKWYCGINSDLSTNLLMCVHTFKKHKKDKKFKKWQIFASSKIKHPMLGTPNNGFIPKLMIQKVAYGRVLHSVQCMQVWKCASLGPPWLNYYVRYAVIFTENNWISQNNLGWITEISN